MPPQESDPLLATQFSVDDEADFGDDDARNKKSSSSILKRYMPWVTIGGACLGFLVAVVVMATSNFFSSNHQGYDMSSSSLRRATGPYKLLQRQVGQTFFEHYEFFDGADSIGSAGYQRYVGEARAKALNLANVTTTRRDDDDEGGQQQQKGGGGEEEFVYLQSVAGKDGGFRESVRLEGKQRFNRGLFVLDVAHMPSGCGVWPAFWMTDEDNWPNNGEIDIVEGINTQSVVKTALHTSESCSMYAHVPDWAKTGVWDTSTGLPDSFTGQPNYINRIQADNCWAMAPHQWGNQGCVLASTDNGTIGEPMNAIGGGVYVLEWDPVNGYIKSWVFKNGEIPKNLQEAMSTTSDESSGSSSSSGSGKVDSQVVVPEPQSWPTPYAYFAIGDGSGCSEDHFQDMRLVFNLAFCGAVAGNRFFKDCPALSQEFNVSSDSVLTCNAYIASEPEALSEAYWKIRGVYVYEREYERQSSNKKSNNDTTTAGEN
jgi:hypothetical protein